LIVDDDPESVEVIHEILAREGYDVETAANGADALALLDSIRPALIFLDVQMPVMDGAEFRQVQRRDRDLIRIPTIVMTAAAVEPLLDLAVEETLRKPVRKDELLRIVRRHCVPSQR
jgi:CheY-like chemotaxis protein